MPGSRDDYDKVLTKIRASKENRLQAELNGTRILKLIRTLKQKNDYIMIKEISVKGDHEYVAENTERHR